MKIMIPFHEVLDAVNQLSLDEQETLIDILNGRTIERRRVELTNEIMEAQKEFQNHLCCPVTPDELMKEILE